MMKNLLLQVCDIFTYLKAEEEEKKEGVENDGERF
jgi:hypothetical protein